LDQNGHPIYDPTGPGNNGADIDAVAVLHGSITMAPEPIGLPTIVSLCGLLRGWRRRRK
jgi:hypothetical protein